MIDILGIGKTILDKIVPDKAQRDAYELKLMELNQNGAFKEDEMRYSAINTEAQSLDKLTSRARPAFLYTMYIIILSSIPVGILYAFNPTYANEIATGFKMWLDSIPQDMWWLFGAGYLGYGAYRSYDKKIGK